MLQASRFWVELCTLLGCPELLEDERFVDDAARYTNRSALVELLDAVFGSKTLDELHGLLDGFSGVWAPVLAPSEIPNHPQIEPNGFLPVVTPQNGNPFRLVPAPMHFDDHPTVPRGAAPELGQHTEEILLETGLDWDEISQLRESGALG